ncbi:SMP-30/gluconolactonase/LRE family protein [soil metagenome]
MTTVDIAIDAGADLGEGPLWDARRARLLWLDITRHQIHEFDPATGQDRTRDVGQPVGAVGLRRQGGLIGALRDGFARIDETGGCTFVASVESENAETRMNDGKVDPSGRFWAGTMALDSSPGAGSLYRLAASGRAERVLTRLTISNGMDWSADRRLMYFIDSVRRTVDVFDYDDPSGAISGRRPLCEVTEGLPDGMTLDAEGQLWVAVWGGGCVLRYSAAGALTGRMTIPVSQVTSCAFGGTDLRDLYVTTASRGLTPDQRAREPHAGALFVCRPGPSGVRPHEYLG